MQLNGTMVVGQNGACTATMYAPQGDFANLTSYNLTAAYAQMGGSVSRAYDAVNGLDIGYSYSGILGTKVRGPLQSLTAAKLLLLHPSRQDELRARPPLNPLSGSVYPDRGLLLHNPVWSDNNSGAPKPLHPLLTSVRACR